MKRLIDFPDTIDNHVLGFMKHYGIKTVSEAYRLLVLGGFISYGNPLNESAKLPMGRPKQLKETEIEVNKHPTLPTPEELYFKIFGLPYDPVKDPFNNTSTEWNHGG